MSYDEELAEEVCDAIEEWKVDLLKTEKQYENELYKYLHKKLPRKQITKQFAHARIRADLAVEEDVIIELKNNLKTTNQYQRLIGQLEQYRQWNGYIVLVLCGKTELNILKEVKSYTDNFSEDEISIFVKPDDDSVKEILQSEKSWLFGFLLVVFIIYMFTQS
jgi:hypothetical protein